MAQKFIKNSLDFLPWLGYNIKVKNAQKHKKAIKRLAILSSIFLLLLFAMVLLRLFPVTSNFLHRHLSLNIIYAMSRVTQLASVSFYEIFLCVAIILLLVCLVSIIALALRRQGLKVLRIFMSIILAASITGSVYFASAGFSYAGAATGLSFFGDDVTEQQFIAVCQYFLDDFNSLAQKLPRDKDGNVVSPYTDKQLSDKLVEEYKRLGGYTPACKTIFLSGIMSEMWIRGVFFAPFGEPNINGLIPACEKPFTMAHEMAHGRGVMLENDADMVAAYITLSSSDDFIRYSGYIERIWYLFEALIDFYGNDEEYQRLTFGENGISRLIKKELENSNKFWLNRNTLNRITSAINNFYLKIMGQKEGTGAYTPDKGGDPNPSNPSNPTNPTDPTSPTNPTNPTNPTDPTNPNSGDVVPSPSYSAPYSALQRLFFQIYNEADEE